MMSLSRLKSACLFLLMLTGWVFADQSAQPEIPAKPVLFSAKVLNLNQEHLIAISYKNEPHWHTYWKNPGDAGLPIKVEFTGAKGTLELEEQAWPAPHRYIEQGDLWAYGYEGGYSLFFKVPKALWKSLQNLSITLNSNWLVCRHICIPGQAKLEGTVQTDGITWKNPVDFELETAELEKRFQALPKTEALPAKLELTLAKHPEKEAFILYYKLQDSSAGKLQAQRNILTPYLQAPFDFKHEALFKDETGNFHGKMEIDWDGAYEEPSIPYPTDGKFKTPYKLKFLFASPESDQVAIIEKTFVDFKVADLEALQADFAKLKPMALTTAAKVEAIPSESTSPGASADQSSLWFILMMAFIGGLILNVMPCVLPVISLKLFGLIQQRGDDNKKLIFKHNIFYSLGILTTFLLLAAVVIALKNVGDSVGWGFQLQSPRFIAVMIFVLFIMALNLFGLFEFRTPGGNTLGGIQLKQGFSGDFLGGVLATILSTPCSAPFLGTALTFAFTSGAMVIVAVFMFIGLGLAFPFILTAFFPKLITFLPKPGFWMEHIKKFLGLTLIFTIIWLLDVFTALVDSSVHTMKLNTILALLFFAFYAYNHMTKRPLWRITLFALPLIFTINLFMSPLQSESAEGVSGTALLQDKLKTGLQWETWSDARMQELKNQQSLVFVDFTAKWCFTCKVNERLVLEREGFKQLVEKYQVKLLLADWTKRDAIIGDWLKAHGMVGVPAYFVQKKNGELVNLGETISLTEIEEHLK